MPIHLPTFPVIWRLRPLRSTSLAPTRLTGVTRHEGIEGNETADEWAREAAESVEDSMARDCLCGTIFARMIGMAAGDPQGTRVDCGQRRSSAPLQTIQKPEAPEGTPLRAQSPHGQVLPAPVRARSDRRLLV